MDLDFVNKDIEEEQESELKQVFLGRGRHARTQTLPDARKLLQVKEAFREKGEEVKDDFLVD